MIDAKWVYTWKVDEHGWLVKAKSRLVARGFKQREGVDFGETFAPTVSSSCVRLLSAIACECDLDLCHLDVDQALFSLISMKMFFCDCRKDVVIFQERSFGSTKVLWIEAGIAYMACSPDDMS